MRHGCLFRFDEGGVGTISIIEREGDHEEKITMPSNKCKAVPGQGMGSSWKDVGPATQLDECASRVQAGEVHANGASVVRGRCLAQFNQRYINETVAGWVSCQFRAAQSLSTSSVLMQRELDKETHRASIRANCEAAGPTPATHAICTVLNAVLSTTVVLLRQRCQLEDAW